MKNAEQIKREAKEQIKKLLDMCGCYKYTDKGIDLWLNTWEKACSPQIEAIAEKSPYYDGKCKIVFPSEYPREFNINGINAFCSWLYNYAERNLTPARINGFTYEESNFARAFCRSILQVNCGDVNDLITGKLKELSSIIDDIRTSQEFEAFRAKCCEAYNAFSNERGVIFHKGNAYSEKDFSNCPVYDASHLADILSNRSARSQFLDQWLVNEFSYYFPNCKFAEGQKLSRAVNKIASQYGLNKDPEWNREFAKYADSINPLNVTKWTVISWNPIDMLTYAFGNSWSSCSTIDKKNVRARKITSSRSSITSYVDTDGDYAFAGEHAASPLSYMFDKTSFIYYTVNHKYDGTHYEEQDKESRIVFSLSEDNTTLLQSRLYPQCNDDNQDDSAYRIPREIVQKVIADALKVPNLWKVKTGSDICRQICESNGVHYDDWKDERNNKVNISWLTELTNEPKTIRLGHAGICPNCGAAHWHVSSLNCEECDPLY